jgi:hypothetical protein
MKKTNLVFLVLFIAAIFFLSAANTWAQAAPTFDQKPSVVLDLWNVGAKGKYDDNIIFRSATLAKNIAFNVYGYDEKKKEWTLIGASQLKDYTDKDQVDPPRGVKIKNYRWFAVHSPTNTKFDAQALPNDSNDLVITIIDKNPVATEKPQGNDAPAFDLKSAKVLDLWAKVKGKYKDNINLRNGIGSKNISFNVWGYDQKNNYWTIIGPKKLSPDPAPPMVFTGWGWYNPATDESVDSTWKDKIKDFRWIAIQSLDGLAFNVDIAAGKSDLTLTVLK